MLLYALDMAVKPKETLDRGMVPEPKRLAAQKAIREMVENGDDEHLGSEGKVGHVLGGFSQQAINNVIIYARVGPRIYDGLLAFLRENRGLDEGSFIALYGSDEDGTYAAYREAIGRYRPKDPSAALAGRTYQEKHGRKVSADTLVTVMQRVDELVLKEQGAIVATAAEKKRQREEAEAEKKRAAASSRSSAPRKTRRRAMG